MDDLRIAENLVALRHSKSVTQEELADFLGVTKSSVSKWETQQSLPDILLLPRIALFFGITIDELVGYRPQLCAEQIRRLYRECAQCFAEKPFDEAMDKSRILVKKYYSCYPFLLQICVLWLNHFMMAGSPQASSAVLGEILRLCARIIDGCRDVAVCSDAVTIKAMVLLQLGRTQEVIELLGPLNSAGRFSAQADTLLIQAYQLSGDLENAILYSQINIYTHLIGLVNISIGLMVFKSDDRRLCEETIGRLDAVISRYGLEKLNANVVLQFYYQSAVYYAGIGNDEKALEYLTRFAEGTVRFLECDATLHGDGYFDRLDSWFEDLPMGEGLPRDKALVYRSVTEALDIPAFESLKDKDQYKYVKLVLGRHVESEP